MEKRVSEFVCDHCGNKFGKKYNILRHIKNVHHGEEITLKDEQPKKLINCFGCDKKFKSKKIMYCHARGAHDAIMDHIQVPKKSGKTIKKKELNFDPEEGEGSGDFLDNFKVLAVS